MAAPFKPLVVRDKLILIMEPPMAQSVKVMARIMKRRVREFARIAGSERVNRM